MNEKLFALTRASSLDDGGSGTIIESYFSDEEEAKKVAKDPRWYQVNGVQGTPYNHNVVEPIKVYSTAEEYFEQQEIEELDRIRAKLTDKELSRLVKWMNQE